jgi:type IV pilus assembly protein PilM
MELFGGKNNYFLGIDIGTSAVKVVELTLHNNLPTLVNYGWVDLDFIDTSKSYTSQEERTRAYIKRLIGRINPKTKEGYVSMPSFNGLVSLASFPLMDKSELQQAIDFEVHKYVPTSLEEVYVSWDLVNRNNASQEKNEKKPVSRIEAQIVIAPKEKVLRYEGLLKDSGVKIGAIELETFSLVRSLVGNDPGCFIIVDIGARATTIILVREGVVEINHSVGVGGNDITNAIADSMNISKQRAEMMKKQGRDFINDRESAIVFPALDNIIGEILRTIQTFQQKPGQSSPTTIDGIILSGGTAKLAGLGDYIGKSVENIKTIVGNPWKKVIYAEKVAPIVEKLGPSFTVAIGLALRGIDERKK